MVRPTLKQLKFSAILIIALFSIVSIVHPASASAINYTDHPADDSTFRAFYTMTPQDIQNFLVSKGSGLATFTDLEDCGPATGSHYAFYDIYYDCGARTQASKIIWDAAQAYGINPQVILATLQKEQSIVTTPNPTAYQYNYAMGYGCPDSGSCSYAGFFNQVDNGTWQFRVDMELSSNNNYWGYTPSSFPCNGPTRYYSAALKPGNDVTFLDDYGTGYARFVIPNASTATLYCYTPHVFPGSSRQYFSGSYNFVYYFLRWFGDSSTPYAFKGTASATVYIYVNGYKVSVPAMGLLQDFGINPNAIQSLEQAKVDNIPTASVDNSGASPTLSYLVKSPSDSDADGGALYLVSVGKKNRVTSLDQLAAYGFSTSNLSYLPLSSIQSIPGSTDLSNYLSTPTASAFQVSASKKRIIFDYQTYINLNPSNFATPVSYYTANLIASGDPLVSQDILIKHADNEIVYLYRNGLYYNISSFDAYNCWGFSSSLNTPLYRLADNSYISPITPASTISSCIVNDGSTAFLLGRNTRYALPPAYGVAAGPTTPTNLLSLVNNIPLANPGLKQYIRGKQNAVVWYIENGAKKQVPTYSNYVLLGLTPQQLTYIDDSALSAIPALGVKLGTGQVVKTDNSAFVYVISGNSRVQYARSDDFLGYNNSWSSIEAYPATVLDMLYPYDGSKKVDPYFYSSALDKVIIADPSGCYLLDSTTLAAYGKSKSAIMSAQTYGAELFPALDTNSCKTASQYVKDSSGAAVYLISGGQKQQFSSWSSLQSYSHQANPYITSLSPGNLAAFPTGSPI